MFDELVQLLILFFVIFDPLVSSTVFSVATKEMTDQERRKTAYIAILVAAILSYLVLFFGNGLLELFSTNIDDFRVAGGIVLGILGLQMALGKSITKDEFGRNKNFQAVAAIIATPFITGPAAITTIIVVTYDYGMLLTGIAITIILAISAVMFFLSGFLDRLPSKIPIQVMSTLMGIITLAWGIKFVREGLGI